MKNYVQKVGMHVRGRTETDELKMELWRANTTYDLSIGQNVLIMSYSVNLEILFNGASLVKELIIKRK